MIRYLFRKITITLEDMYLTINLNMLVHSFISSLIYKRNIIYRLSFLEDVRIVNI